MPPGSLNRVLALIGWVEGGNVMHPRNVSSRCSVDYLRTAHSVYFTLHYFTVVSAAVRVSQPFHHSA